jgi:hypothetical protein
MAPLDEVFRRSLSILLTVYFVAGVAVIAGLGFAIRSVVRAYFKPSPGGSTDHTELA